MHIANIHTKHFHFIGIGGIGMSGIASILLQQGHIISGCDIDDTQSTVHQLKKLGCTFHKGNNADACHALPIDVLIYIPMYAQTIPAVTAEIAAARQKNITILSRAQLLAELMYNKYSIAVSGSHGKTTTSCLIAHILMSANVDPTVVVGGQLKNISSNAHHGNGKHIVVEADESDRSFLALTPNISVITNIDVEHLETYTDLEDIKDTYTQFLFNTQQNGKVIICADDKNSMSLNLSSCNTTTYGIKNSADLQATNIVLHSDFSTFTIMQKDKPYFCLPITLPLAGTYNIYNALAAIAVAQNLGITSNIIQKGLATFAGVERRFAFHGLYKEAEIFDDYGHHPKEIENIILAARKRAKNKLMVIFQPHRYTRTAKLWNDFIAVLSTDAIDTLIITDIYAAGETSLEHITSKRLVDQLNTLNLSGKIIYVPLEDNFKSIKHTIDQYIDKNDLLLFLGAGKMHLIAQELTS